VLPGPASSQLGIAIGTLRAGVLGGVLASICFTLPSAVLLALFALLVRGFHLADAGWTSIQGVLKGVNAAVVGILLAALYDPLWTSAVATPADVALAAVPFGLLQFWRLPPWVAVGAGAAGGMLISWLARALAFAARETGNRVERPPRAPPTLRD